MTPFELMIKNVEIQSEAIYCYYDYEKEERIVLTDLEALHKPIKYIYCEKNTIYIEVESED